MMSLTEEYFQTWKELQDEFIPEKDRLLFVIQVGSFYEAYEYEEKGSAKKLSELLKMVLTKRNNKIDASIENPYMCGFPIYTLSKHLSRLNDEGYTVAVYEQDEEDKKRRKRKGVYSPLLRADFEKEESYHVEEKTQETILYGFLVEKYSMQERERTKKKIKTQRYLLSYCMINLNTGDVKYDEMDEKTLYEGFHQFFLRYRPDHVLFYKKGVTLEKEELEGLSFYQSHISSFLVCEDEQMSPSQQQLFFHKCYFFSSQEHYLSFLQDCQLDRYPNVVDCLCRMYKYLYQHDPVFITQLGFPYQEKKKQSVVSFNYDLYHELNLFSVNENDRYYTKKRYETIFSILSSEMNILGKRHLYHILQSPFSETERINTRQEEIMECGTFPESFQHFFLKSCLDLDTFYLKWKRKKIASSKIYELLFVYQELCKNVFSNFVQGEEEDGCNGWQQKILDFDLPNISKMSIKDFATSLSSLLQFFLDTWDIEKLKEGIFHPHVPCKQWIQMQQIKEGLQQQKKEFMLSVGIPSSTQQRELKKQDQQKKDDRQEEKGMEETVFSLPMKKWKTISNEWLQKGYYEVSKTTLQVKISHPTLDRIGLLYKETESQMSQWNRKSFYEFCINHWFPRAEKILPAVHHFFSRYSCYIPLYHFFKKNHYQKPQTSLSSSPFLEFEDLRHPILEHVNSNDLFVPFSQSLGINEKIGMLVYGINGSGKSTLLRSIGTAIWLAQCGLFVPCRFFHFSPFHSLYSKINIQDNMYIGHSTFVAEMFELKHILQNADSHSLILCDELTSGTESHSASALVASTMIELLERKSLFLFTTHLHQILSFPQIKPFLSNLHIMHFEMNITIPKENSLFIPSLLSRYDRKLVEGTGKHLYGIEIARRLRLPDSFITRAFQIRENKKTISKYNKDLIVSHCLVCHSTENLHTHHITPQKEFTEDTFHSKDGLYNLIVLCQYCHLQTHHPHLEEEEEK